MEVKEKEKTLAGLFLRYIALFCGSTVLIAAGSLLVMLCAASGGFLLPANHAETELSKKEEQIRRAEASPEQWIPGGCTYGVYSREGAWLAGNFPEEERESAWAHYEQNNLYAEYKGYYRFVPLDDGRICIVKYRLIVRYADERLNAFLPAPEALMPMLDVILFLVNAVLLSRRFAERVKQQLWELRLITEKIAGNDLEFETKVSDVREINEIMISLGHMKDALQTSLKAQWDMEKQKQEQLSALAHDIRTPLTVIRGNAELLKERVSLEDKECTEYILANVEEIEKYLETMKQVMHGTERKEKQTILQCESLAELLAETAKQISAAAKLPISVEVAPTEGMISCNKEDILRAWSNLVSNGVEHTDWERGVSVLIGPGYRERRPYLTATLRDFGKGFSPKDLEYADQEFYSGDTSRHDRRHSGLGLSIAKKFVKEQGGFLEFGNAQTGPGAETALWLIISEELSAD